MLYTGEYGTRSLAERFGDFGRAVFGLIIGFICLLCGGLIVELFGDNWSDSVSWIVIAVVGFAAMYLFGFLYDLATSAANNDVDDIERNKDTNTNPSETEHSDTL